MRKITSYPAIASLVFAFAGFASHASMAQSANALSSFDNICLAEARRAETVHGVPAGLLQSITRVEAGRKTVTGEFMPWAWTLNDAGEGLFFDDRASARSYLEQAVASPDHSVDVGCMQVNTKWHSEGFLDIGDMLDPVQNADYAATFLLDLFAAHGSWDDAVKHYHSSLPEKNIVYHQRVLSELEMFLTASKNVKSVPDPASPDLGAAIPAAPEPIPAITPTEIGAAGIAPVPTAPNAPVADGQNRASAFDETSVMAGAELKVAEEADGNGMTRTPVEGAVQPAQSKQPNLAGQWDRVEHFRNLLAREAG